MLPWIPSLAAEVPTGKLAASDVVWTSPSVDAAGSMPIGNGEVVLNAWVEAATGDLLFYIARTDALSEVSRVLKLGRIRIHFAPTPYLGSDFKQHLQLHDGMISVSGGGVRTLLFVDSDADVVHAVGEARDPVTVTATVECWRNGARSIPKDEQRSAWSVHDAPFPLIESGDVFLPAPNAVTWYHRNETSVVPKLWENQSLTGLKGRFDPLIGRTFGGMMTGSGTAVTAEARRFRAAGRAVVSPGPVTRFEVSIATASRQTSTVDQLLRAVQRESRKASPATAFERTTSWWHEFWNRSWVFASGDFGGESVPSNNHELRKGLDQQGGNVFKGEIDHWLWSVDGAASRTDTPTQMDVHRDLRLSATITPQELTPGRIFDKLTPGGSDGFLFDTHPGDGLRLIVGRMTLTAPHCLQAGKTCSVWASYDQTTGESAIYQDGKRVAYRAPETGSPVSRGYALQRYVQACQGRGTYPIKFNGGYYTVEPAAMGQPFNADWRQWGDSHWWQNVRHMYEPMAEQGDTEMTESLFRMYESVRTLAESRTKAYHGAQGAYFPETMTVFGTYSGGDYGWDRTGHQPKDVLCPWWQYAWNQGPELVALMLDRWDATRDEAFLKRRVLPMAESVLRYFDTRFRKESGKIVLDPTQSVETYWKGVVNDMPATAGLIAVTQRLTTLPSKLTTASQRAFFQHMRNACPDLPVADGLLKPAQKYDPQTSNVENPELYAVWPFQVVSLSHSKLLQEARAAYAKRLNHLDTGWGYDGNVAALLGMTDEAARILRVKCANSNPAYRWPATWGPNFDWLPDQNHGGNLLETTNLMLLQSDSMEDGGAIRILPAWPKNWDVDYKLHAAANTTVHCRTKNGKIVELQVVPADRVKDIVWPEGWQRPQ